MINLYKTRSYLGALALVNAILVLQVALLAKTSTLSYFNGDYYTIGWVLLFSIMLEVAPPNHNRHSKTLIGED